LVFLLRNDISHPTGLDRQELAAQPSAEEQAKQMILLKVLRGLSADDVLKEMEFIPLTCTLSPGTL
jgi:hypothetical protein